MPLEARPTLGQDAPPIRPFIHASGIVYGIFYGWRSMTGSFSTWAQITTDIVVVHDDNWGIGPVDFQIC